MWLDFGSASQFVTLDDHMIALYSDLIVLMLEPALGKLQDVT